MQENPQNSLKKLVPYIYSPQKQPLNTQWRKNLTDPFIYVSFSIKQLFGAYGTEGYLQYLHKKYDFLEIEKNIQSIFKDFIQKEWIEKAGLPVKFLSEAENFNTIENKNICFIMNSEIPLKTLYYLERVYENAKTFTRGYTAYLEQEAENLPVPAKIVFFPKIYFYDITSEIIFTLLHETGHALADFKHFVNLLGETPPFNDSLKCLDTIMATSIEFCPPAFKIKEELFGNKPYDSIVFSSNVETIKKNKLIEAAYPTTIGPVDILAAEAFSAEWGRKNSERPSWHTWATDSLKSLFYRHSASQKAPQSKKEIKQQLRAGNLFSETLNILEIKILNYSLNLAQQCPSYFPKDVPSYWSFNPRSKALFFSSPQHNQNNFQNTALAANTTRAIISP